MYNIDIASMVCGAGITFFVIHSERGLIIRNVISGVEYFNRMLACAFCTGYWVGVLIGVLQAALITSVSYEGPIALSILRSIFSIIMLGMGTGIVSIVLDRMIDLGDSAVHGVSMILAMSDIGKEDIVELESSIEEDTTRT